MEAREHLRKTGTNRFPWRHSFARKYIAAFYWLTPFASSFVNSDCLGLVIYFFTLTNRMVHKSLHGQLFRQKPSPSPPTFNVRSLCEQCRDAMKSSLVSAMLIEHRPLVFFSIYSWSKLKYIFELGRWIANLPEKWKMNSLQCCCLSR